MAHRPSSSANFSHSPASAASAISRVKLEIERNAEMICKLFIKASRFPRAGEGHGILCRTNGHGRRAQSSAIHHIGRADFSPRVAELAEQAGDFLDIFAVVMQVGLQQTAPHIFIESVQL